VEIQVRAYAELVDLVDRAESEVPFGRPRSVKDLLSSIGLPRCELGLILVDGEAVALDHLLTGGERVAAYPPFHQLTPDAGTSLWPEPPDPRRFVLDVHLGTLARRLRLLGFDSWYRTHAADDELAAVAEAEGRILLSRDRQLLLRRTVVHGYCPRADDPDEQLAEVVERYGLTDRAMPLTRCVRCNGELLAVDKAEVLAELPPRTRLAFDTFVRCTSCRQVYWPGAHAPAIEAILGGVVDRR
jgi:uncharacterized protein